MFDDLDRVTVRFGIKWVSPEFEALVAFADPELVEAARKGWHVQEHPSDELHAVFERCCDWMVRGLERVGLSTKDTFRVTEFHRKV